MQTKEELILKLFAKKCSEAELKMLLQLIREDQSGPAPEVMNELFEQIKTSLSTKNCRRRYLGTCLSVCGPIFHERQLGCS